MYICVCQAITDRQVKSAIEGGADSVDKLRATLGVASCCGSCEPTAAELIQEVRSQSPAVGVYSPA